MDKIIEQNQTVFLVDDDSNIRSTLSRALRKRGYDVCAYESATQFLKYYSTDKAGCLVLDYGMPGVNGLELQSLLSEESISIPIIFISGHGGVPESVQAMKGGAVDFLEKPFRQNVLVDCIETALKNDRDRRAHDVLRSATLEKFERLTSREKEIADFMRDNPSHTSSKDIGREMGISPRTVDHHRARILEKLGIKSVAELIDLFLVVSPG